MSVAFNTAARHRVIAANSHWYREPTAPLYLNRALQCHDFIYLIDGEWLITENSTDFLLERGDVLILASGQHHYTRFPCAPDTRTICLHISNEPGDLCGMPDTLMLPSLIHAADCPGVRARFEDIVSAAWKESGHKEERLSALIDLLLFDLADACAGLKSGSFSLADEILRLINEDPRKNYRLEELEARFGVSAKAINAAVQERVGATFPKYQSELKLRMVSQHLMMEPEAPLKEIAAMFGFCDEFHLSKAFKARYGVSPSKYRDGSI